MQNRDIKFCYAHKSINPLKIHFYVKNVTFWIIGNPRDYNQFLRGLLICEHNESFMSLFYFFETNILKKKLGWSDHFENWVL